MSTAVTWNPATNIKGSISSNTFTKDFAGVDWNSGCATTGTLAASSTGSVDFTTSGGNVMAGLSPTAFTGTPVNESYKMSGSYLMYKDGVYESGTEVYSDPTWSGTTFKVVKESSTVIKYYLDDVEVYESTDTSTKPALYGVAAIESNTATCTMNSTFAGGSATSTLLPPPPIVLRYF